MPAGPRRLLERLTDVGPRRWSARRAAARRAAGPRAPAAGPSRHRSRAQALGDAVADAGAILIVDRVHAVRIAAKRLRYALELTGELRLARTAALVSSLRAVQDVLGELHDLDVLRAEAARLRSDAAAGLDRRQGSRAACRRPSTRTSASCTPATCAARAALAALTDRVRDRIAPCLDPSIST